jgi:short-subunit dehydrogenase
MSLQGKRILLTGASGGIGRHIASELGRRAARLVLIGRDRNRLDVVADAIRASGGFATVLPFDLASREGHEALVNNAADALGGLDVLINNAGVQRFAPLADEDPAALTRLIAINVTSPLLLTRAALLHFRTQADGHIVNIGSTFGTIGFPHFAAYSASKFALRGMSEALRRELSDHRVGVTYISPRATATDMNTAAVRAMQERLGTPVDDPASVAKAVVRAIEGGVPEKQLGWPERFFVRLNGLLPRLVDRALIKQGRIAEAYVRTDAPENAAKRVRTESTMRECSTLDMH